MFFNISNNAKKFEYIQFKNRIRSVTKDFLPQRKHILQNYIPFLAIYLYFSPLIEIDLFQLREHTNSCVAGSREYDDLFSSCAEYKFRTFESYF